MASSKNWRFSAAIWLALLVSGFAAPKAADTLHLAVHEERVADTVVLLNAGEDANAPNRYGITPLSLACANGNAELVGILLKAGAKADADDERGVTPLMTAARTGVDAVVQQLLQSGAKVNATDKKDQTALMWAAVEGHASTVKQLLKAGAEREAQLGSGFNAMFFAARQGHLTVVEALLADGADANAAMKNKGGGRSPRKNSSALILAIENGHFDVATTLLKAGADANDMRTGQGPLHTLSWVRKPVRGDGIDGAPPPRGSGSTTSLQFVDTLVEYGADVNLAIKGGSSDFRRLGKGGSTPFLLAARTADIDFMKRLIKHGADPKTPNKQGRTPLLAAAGVALGAEADEAASEDEALLAVSFLLELGADINHVGDSGDTIMHAAAYKQAPKLVALLAEKGADIEIWNQKNKKGWTPLLIAQGFRYGNFKPSAPTIEALSKVMLAAGVTPPASPPPPSTEKRKKYGT